MAVAPPGSGRAGQCWQTLRPHSLGICQVTAPEKLPAVRVDEAALMAQFECQYIVGLIGVVTVGSPVMVVLEFCEHGSLEHYLANTDIDLPTQYQFAGDITEGLTYLASINVVHRDLAARNVLISSERRCKISDFGMSRETHMSEFYQSKGGQVRSMMMVMMTTTSTSSRPLCFVI